MTTAVMAKPETRAPRKASRESRREQLIEATIETIAANGLSRTTLTEVANAAGLSHGLVNFHFRSKDRLLAETLLYLSEEYRQNWTRALAAAGPSPAERLDALIRADYAPAISTPARLKAWCAFWGEAQSRPVYQETCGANDRAYVRELEAVCAALIAETGARPRPDAGGAHPAADHRGDLARPDHDDDALLARRGARHCLRLRLGVLPGPLRLARDAPQGLIGTGRSRRGFGLPRRCAAGSAMPVVAQRPRRWRRASNSAAA